MKILIKQAKILDENSTYHKKTVDVLITKGQIRKIGKSLTDKADKEINGKGCLLSIGWFDMQTVSGDPGNEHKEDFSSLKAAALAGGFTAIAVLPKNKPVTQSKNDISYLKNQSDAVDIYPVAAVTRDTKGEELTEMIDLHTAGAIAFSDGLRTIWHTDILLKSLQYLQKFDGLLINRPEDIYLNMFGVMNEGESSTMLGMKGMPVLSEVLSIKRDLEVLNYAGGKLHFSNVSTLEGIKLIKSAKKSGLNVTCDIASFQTSFTDNDLNDFDTNLKVNPPFRSKKDNTALLKALQDGTIDVIVSSHQPHDEESKKLEFDLADFGVSSLQTTASDLCRMAKDVDIELLINKVTKAPRELLGQEVPTIAEGEKANLTLLDPNAEWKLDATTNKSKSANSPFWSKNLKGRVKAVINKGEFFGF